MATASFVTDLTEIITQAAEAAAGIGSIISALKMLEISRDYYKLYAEQKNFYYSTFQQGAEAPLLGEIYALPFYNKDYAGRVATAYNTVTGPFGGASTDILGWWTRHASMYGGVKDDISEFEVDRERIRSDWTNYLFRFEELWADIRNDDRWNKRLSVHNIGLKVGSQVAATLQSSLGEYQGHIADLSSQLATYGNGIAKYAGYKRGLSDVTDGFTTGADYTPNTPPAPVATGTVFNVQGQRATPVDMTGGLGRE